MAVYKCYLVHSLVPVKWAQLGVRDNGLALWGEGRMTVTCELSIGGGV